MLGDIHIFHFIQKKFGSQHLSQHNWLPSLYIAVNKLAPLMFMNLFWLPEWEKPYSTHPEIVGDIHIFHFIQKKFSSQHLSQHNWLPSPYIAVSKLAPLMFTNLFWLPQGEKSYSNHPGMKGDIHIFHFIQAKFGSKHLSWHNWLPSVYIDSSKYGKGTLFDVVEFILASRVRKTILNPPWDVRGHSYLSFHPEKNLGLSTYFSTIDSRVCI